VCCGIRRLQCAITFGAVVACLSAASGADGTSFEAFTPAPVPAHRLVFRVSDAMLASYLAREVRQQVSVQDVILGTTVNGSAQIEAQSCVTLLERPENAAFQVEFRGTAVSRTVGRNGPAIIHSRSVTHFTATKQIVYETGKGFSGGPVQVSARTQNFTEGIGSTRRGLIGRIVRRKAAEQIAAQKALTTEIARTKSARRIAAAFEQQMGERIAHLNSMIESQSLWAQLVGGAGRMPYVCCSTPGHLQIAAGQSAQAQRIALPVHGPASDTAAPFEVWMHNSLLPERPGSLVKPLQRLSMVSEAFDAFSAVAAPGALVRKRSLESAVQGLASKVAVQSIQGWVVVEVLPDQQTPAARTAAVSVPVR